MISYLLRVKIFFTENVGEETMIAEKIALVSVSDKHEKVLVPITSDDKPEISKDLTQKWQEILNITANILNVPAGLIMRLHEKEIEVFLSSQTEKNPYEPHEKAQLQTSLYCETVVGTRDELVVPNAKKDPQWKDNPDVALNMISYYGVPIIWPDGEIFGTFCVLDYKENSYSSDYRRLITLLRNIIENDLERLMMLQNLEQDKFRKETQLREIHHRIKNHFNLILASINLESRFADSETNIQDLLAGIGARISAISLIHTQLYTSQDMDQISLKTYLHELGIQLIKHFTNKNIRFSCEGNEQMVDSNISIPCGLLVCEWMTNSIKHAFSEIKRPEISIKIEEESSSGNITLSYEDNGKGLPDTHHFDQAKSLGMTLIRSFTEQLSGSLSVNLENGLRYILKFNPRDIIKSYNYR